MIKSVTLRDFQAHRESKFEFSEGVNCIIGTSDHGKSSLIRAINWVRTNRPGGTGFIRRGQERAVVEIEVVRDGKTILITRTRSASENSYTCGDQEFKTVGKEVPEEVLEVLGLDDVNIQKQIDLPYLITETPGTIATTFNKFTNLDRADKVISILSTKIRDGEKRTASLEEEVSDYQKTIESYDWLDDFEELVGLVEEIEREEEKETKAVDKLQQGIFSINETVKDIEVAKTKVKKLKPLIDKMTHLCDKWGKIDIDIAAAQQSHDQLEELLESLKRTARELESNAKLPKRLNKELELRKKLLKLEEKLQVAQHSKDMLFNLVSFIGDAESSIESEIEKVERKKKQLTESRKELAKLLENCPTCEQKLDEKSRAKVLENLK